MTSHPKDLSDKLIEVMKNEPKICRQLHLPVQCGSTKLLQKMNRHYTKDQYLNLVDKIRKEIPDISLSTDIMIGFPGETEEDIQDTMDVIRHSQYDQVFTFIYSIRTGTPAASMEQLPAEISEDCSKGYKPCTQAQTEFQQCLPVSLAAHEILERSASDLTISPV